MDLVTISLTVVNHQFKVSDDGLGFADAHHNTIEQARDDIDDRLAIYEDQGCVVEVEGDE